jgi:hypothetical protein
VAKQTKTIVKIKANGREIEVVYPSKAAAMRACLDYAVRSNSNANLSAIQ